MNLPNEIENTESVPKPRKPYIMTKQREKWTKEEHAKFLEALRLHGRAWRMIEEHIGTKTPLQIRSHAQKFFAKVTREGNNEVEIPPPRPKRKPTHPYPRKEIHPGGKKIKISDQSKDSLRLPPLPTSTVSEDISPTSVLTPLRSEKANGFFPDEPRGCTFSCASTSGREELYPENRIGGEDDEYITTGFKSDGRVSESTSGKKKRKSDLKAGDCEEPVKTLKLFGQTVSVADSGKRAPATADSAGRLPGNSAPGIGNGIDGDSTMCSLAGGFLPMLYCLPPYGGANNSALVAGMVPVVHHWALYRNMPFTVVGEGSDSATRSNVPARDEAATANPAARGFMPYRKT